jgi:hypothetical protein
METWVRSQFSPIIPVSMSQYFSTHISYSRFINLVSTLHIAAVDAVVMRTPPSPQ